MTLRTKETEERYHRDMKKLPKGYCPFCNPDLVIEKFEYWEIWRNKYEYDKFFNVSNMLVCKRHVEDEDDLKQYEKIELKSIKKRILGGDYYKCWLENTRPYKSVPLHLHYHLLKF